MLHAERPSAGTLLKASVTLAGRAMCASDARLGRMFASATSCCAANKMLTVWCGLWGAGALAGYYYYYYLQRRKKKKPSRVSLSCLPAPSMPACMVLTVHPSGPRLQVVIAITGFGKFKGVDENPTQRYRHMPE